MVQYPLSDIIRENSLFKADWFSSSITKTDLKVFSKLYEITNSVTLKVPKANEFSSHQRLNEVAFNEELFLF